MIPLYTDRRLRHTPWVNATLIVINLLIFLGTRRQIEASHEVGAQLHLLEQQFPILKYYLSPASPHWTQYLTYQFLHDGWQHVGFNMLFLWVFGNSLEDRL